MEEEIIETIEETFDYNKLRYILDKDGYLCHASLGGLIVCDLGECTEYNGDVPEMYETIEEWYDEELENLNAWKIVDGNLIFDENKYNELQAKYELEAEENACSTHKWVNERLNQTSTIYDDNFSASTNELLINDSGDYEIPEIVIKGKGSIVEASGSLIEDAKPTTLEELNIYGKSEQETRSGKNLLPFIKKTKETLNGVTFTNVYNIDGSLAYVNIVGTATATTTYRYYGVDTVTPQKTFDKPVKIGFGQTGSNTTFCMAVWGLNSSGANIGKVIYEETDYETGFQLAGIGLRVFSGATINIKLYPMISVDGGEYEPYTNGATPNPDFPSEVKTIKGIENLFDGLVEVGGYNNDTGEKRTNNTQLRNVNMMNVFPNSTYSFSLNGKNINLLVRYFFYDKNKIWIGSNTSENGVITTPDNCYYLTWHSTALKTNYGTDLPNPMLEKGTIAHSYIPYGRWLPVKARGKNWFDYENTTNYKTYTGATISKIDNGIRIQQTGSGMYKFAGYKLNVKPMLGKTFTLSCDYKANSNNVAGITIYWLNGNNLNTEYRIAVLQGNGGTFTIPEEEKFEQIVILFYSNYNGTGNANDYVDYTNIQLELGDTKTDLEPYKEPTIAYIDMNKPNLFDNNIEAWEDRKYNASTSKTNTGVKITNTANGVFGDSYYAGYRLFDLTEYAGKTITLSCNVVCSSVNRGQINIGTCNELFESRTTLNTSGAITSGKYKKTFNVPSTITDNNKYLSLTLYSQVSDSQSVAGDYVEYNDLKIYEGINDYYEFASINDVKDIYDLVSGTLTKRIGKIVLDGSENWNKNASYEQIYYISTNSINDMLNSNTNAFVSDYYTYYGTISSSASMSKVGIYMWWNGTTNLKRVNIKHTEDLTLEEYKAWLSENPITVYYILSEPQTIQLEPNNLELFKGYNYITIEDELEPNIDVTYNSFNTYFEDGLKFQISNDNILINEAINQSINGVDFTINEDKSITIKGKATDNIELLLNGSMDNIDPIFMLNDKFTIGGLSNGYVIIGSEINLNLYSYNGTDRELVYSGRGGNVNFEETKCVTCSTLSLPANGNFDITIKPYITTSNEYIEAKLNDLVDVGITKLGEDEHLEIDRSYITLVGKDETILKSIEAQRTFKPNTLILLNSDDLEVTTKYFTNDYINERVAKIEVKQEEIDIEVSKKVNAEDVAAQLELKLDRTENDQIVSMLNASANEINITGNRIAITSDNFQITKEGIITAKAGTLGGWDIGDTRIYKSTDTFEVGVHDGTTGNYLAVHNKQNNTYPFWVHSDGEMYAENATINGKLYSTSGKIAGFTIDEWALWCSSEGATTWEDSGYRARIGKWNGNLGDFAFSVHKDNTVPFWVSYEGRLHAENVDITGTINATSGSITGSLVTGTISSAGIDIYNGTGFVRALLSNSYHPYVSALNVATHGDFSGGISFRDSKTRTSVGDEMAHISCNQYNAMDIYSIGTININHGVNSSGTSIQEGGNVGICALTIESNTIRGSGGGYMYANSNCMFHPASGYHAYINTTDEVNKIMTYGGGAISSRNVKKDLVNIQDDYKNLYEEIRNMNLYTFKYKYEGIKDREDDFGFIIDELEDTKYISKYIMNYDLKGNIVDGKLVPKTDDDVKDEDLHFSYKGWDRDSYLKCLFVMIKSLQNKIDELEEKYEQ